MIPVEQALHDYGRRCAVSTLDVYPLVWAGHYSDRLLGEYGIPQIPEGSEGLSKVVFGCILPFGYSSAVQASFTVIDAYYVKTRRELYVTRLLRMSGGVLTTHWVVPYRIDDYETIFGEPTKTFYYVPKVHQAYALLADKRMTGEYDVTWDEADTVGRHQLEEILR